MGTIIFQGEEYEEEPLNASPSKEERLQNLDSDESQAIVDINSINLAQFQSKHNSNMAMLYGQGLADSIVNQAMEVPAQMAILMGKKDEELFGDEKSFQIKTAEKFRNFAVAIRQKTGLDQMKPEGFGEQVVAGLGSATGSMIGMFASAAVGAGIGGAVGGPAGAVVGGIVAPYVTSYATEKAFLSKELMDAGYSATFADNVSNLYAFPVAAIDYASFKTLGKAMRPVVQQVVRNSVGKWATKFLSTTAGQAIKGGIKAGVTEGGTEAIQGVIQNEFEIANKLKGRNFTEDLTDRTVEFIVGSLIGGSTATVGQLTSRKNTIDKITQESGLPRDVVGKFVDEVNIDGHDKVLDMMVDKAGVSEQMAWIEKAFAKIEGKELQITAPVEEIKSEEYSFTKDLLNSVETDEQTTSVVSNLENLTQQQQDIKKQIRQADSILRPQIKEEIVKTNPELITIQEKIDLLRDKFSKETGREAFHTEARIRALEHQLEYVSEAEVDKVIKQKVKDFKNLSKEKIATLENKSQILKQEYQEYIPKNPALKNIQDEINQLKVQLQTETGSMAYSTENRIEALQARLESPGRAKEFIQKLEDTVEELQSSAIENLNKIQDLESQLASEILTDEQTAQVKKELETLEMQAVQDSRAILKAERVAEGFRQEAKKLEGDVAYTPAQVKQEAKKSLNNFVTAYQVGRQVSEQEFKSVQKAFRTLLQGSKLPAKALSRLLRNVLSIRTAPQFNAKVGVIIDSINTIIKNEQIKSIQNLTEQVLERMIERDRLVSPQTRLFAEHLKRVLTGAVPLKYDFNSNDSVELAKAQLENAVYDVANGIDDVNTTQRAFGVIKDFYKNQLQKYQDFKEAQAREQQELTKLLANALKQGKPIDDFKQAFDRVRQQAKKNSIWNTLAPTPYTTSVLTILDSLDSKSGFPTMQGPLVKAFNSEKHYMKWIELTDWAKINLDKKMQDIYGKHFLKYWSEAIGQDFLTVDRDIDGNFQQVNINRASAMSLWMMTKMPQTRQALLDQGLTPTWLEAFERGDNVNFSDKDYAWMKNVREVLDEYGNKIAPLYEKLTGKPFRLVDNYFMTFRYMLESEEGALAENSSIIDSMLKGNYENLSSTDKNNFKIRKNSEKLFNLPDIYQAITKYAVEMNHFLAYAEYATKLRNTFQTSSMRELMKQNLSPSIPAVMDEYINTMIQGSPNRSADRQAMKGFFWMLSNYSRNLIANPKNLLRQISGLAAVTQVKGIGGLELANAVIDLPRAFKSGEIKAFLDTPYMRQRYEGFYDFAAKYSEDISRADWFSAVKDKGVIGKVRQGLASQTLHNVLTMPSRWGDRAASLIGGWAVYQKVLKATKNQDAAVKAAIKVVDDTQQSMDPGKVPVAFNRTNLTDRLLTIFQRTPAIYLDQYLRAWKAVKSGQMSKSDFARTMMTYHVWIPLFEVMITSGFDFEKDETLQAMVAGPLAYTIILGNALRAIVGGVMEGMTEGEADLPPYLTDPSDSSLVGSFARDITKTIKMVAKAVNECPDWENMWGVTKAAAKIGNIGVLPTGWLIQTPEGVYDLLSMDLDQMLRGMKKLVGYSEYRTKEKD